jgi:SAM-dependent methyltransferase
MTIIDKFFSGLFPSFDCETKPIDSQMQSIAKELCPENFGRMLVLTEFLTKIKNCFLSKSNLKVALVGGYRTEPEIRALEYLGYSLDLHIFGIEQDMIKLDLNTMSKNTSATHGSFDLVLCSQVWEHIWNYEVAFLNLISLMSNGSYLWIAAPASNRRHGSPLYFSSGFTSEYFANNLTRIGLVVDSHEQLGTRRNYLATHILPTWLSVIGHKFPPLAAFSEHSLLPRVLLTIRYLVKTFGLLFASKKITTSGKFATESWALAKME